MSRAEDLKFDRKKKYSRQSPAAFGHIKYEGVWTHDAWVRHKDAVRERLEALRASHNAGLKLARATCSVVAVKTLRVGGHVGN